MRRVERLGRRDAHRVRAAGARRGDDRGAQVPVAQSVGNPPRRRGTGKARSIAAISSARQHEIAGGGVLRDVRDCRCFGDREDRLVARQEREDDRVRA